MALNQVCSDFIKKLEHLEKFSELKTNNDRIKFTHNCFRNHFSNLNFKRSFKNNKTSHEVVEKAKFSSVADRCWEAIKLYSQALAYAEDKFTLRLAFKRRADELFFIQRYDECSRDDLRVKELAEQSEATPEDSKRLCDVKRKSQFQYLISRGEISPLHGGTSSFFDSASVSVGLGYSDCFERQLVARNDIKTGEVLIVEKPYASVLLSRHCYTHCTHCFTRILDLEPCRSCCFAMFCSKQCKNNSLESYHEIECSVMDILVQLRVERMELLSLRLLICASNQGKSLKQLYETIQELDNVKNKNGKNNDSINSKSYKSSDFMNIYNLVTNSSKRSPPDLFYRCVVSSALVQILSKYTKFFSYVPDNEKQMYEEFCVGLIFHFMQSLPCNAHEISEFTADGLDEIGAGIYATLSLVNHSCDPNVVRHSCGDTIVLRAIKPIKKNEQILDNYGYHYATHSLSERQTALMKQYYFKCECQACAHIWPKYEHLPKEIVKFKGNVNRKVYSKLTEKFETNLKNAINGQFNSQTAEEFAKYLDYLDEFVVLPWQNFNNCQEALKHCWCYKGNHFRQSLAVI